MSGKRVLLPRDLGSKAALLIIGFTHGSQAQTKAWGVRVRDRFPTWSIAVLEDVPHLVRGVVSHGIKSGIPKEQYGRFLLVYHGEKETPVRLSGGTSKAEAMASCPRISSSCDKLAASHQ